MYPGKKGKRAVKRLKSWHSEYALRGHEGRLVEYAGRGRRCPQASLGDLGIGMSRLHIIYTRAVGMMAW